MKRALIAGAALLAVVLVIVAACGLGGDGASGRFMTVRPHPVTVRLVEFGDLEARSVRTVLAPLSGEVIWVADEGTPAKAGQAVLKMSTESLQARLDEDRRAGVGLAGRLATNQAVARAMKKKGQAAVRIAEINLGIARQRLAEAKARPTADEKKLADLNLAADRLRAERAEADEKSLRLLAARGFVSEAKAKAARLALVRARAQLVRATAAHREVTAGTAPETVRAREVSVKKAEMNLAQARFDAVADAAGALEQVAVAKVRYDVYCKRLARIEKDIASAAALSPIDGVVALVDVWKGGSDLSPVQVGETHRRGREMMKMADLSALRVRVHINERDIVRVKLGQEAAVRLKSHPGRVYRAKVAEIAIFADDKNRLLGSLAMEKSGSAGVNVVRVLLDLEVPAGAEKPRLGSSAEVELVVRQFDAALTVPLAALLWKEGQPFARVLANGGAREVSVTVAASTEDEAVISSGLAEGDKVLLPEGSKGITQWPTTAP